MLRRDVVEEEPLVHRPGAVESSRHRSTRTTALRITIESSGWCAARSIAIESLGYPSIRLRRPVREVGTALTDGARIVVSIELRAL